MPFVTIVKTLISLMPALIQGVQLLDAALPEYGQGSKKLEALKGLLQSAYSTATDTSTAFETLWPAISGTVSALVALVKK